MQLYPPNAAPVLPTILTGPLGTVEEQSLAAQQAASSESPYSSECASLTVCFAPDMPILNTIPNLPEPAPQPVASTTPATGLPLSLPLSLSPSLSLKLTGTMCVAGSGVDAKSLDVIQAKLQQAQEEKQKQTGQEVTTLQQEENVSISGSNARLMIMKKLSRKSEVRCRIRTSR